MWLLVAIAGTSFLPSSLSAAVETTTTSVVSNNRTRRSLIVGGQVVEKQPLNGGNSTRHRNPPSNSAFVWTGLVAAGWGCGGALIHSDIVISAGHCLWAFNETMKVYIGSYLIDNHDNAGETVGVKKILPHPDHVMNNNDILLVQLERASSVKPYRYNTDPVIPNVMVDPITIFGFGTTAEGGNLSTALREVEVYAFNDSACVDTYPDAIAKIHLCAGTVEGGKDACDSDSGTPLLVGNTVVAITDDGIGCGRPNIPSINARLSGYVDWITQSICDLSQYPPKSCKKMNSTTSKPTSANATKVKPTTKRPDSLVGPDGDGSTSVRARPLNSNAGQGGISVTKVVILSLLSVSAILTFRYYKGNRKSVHYQEIPTVNTSYA